MAHIMSMPSVILPQEIFKGDSKSKHYFYHSHITLRVSNFDRLQSEGFVLNHHHRWQMIKNKTVLLSSRPSCWICLNWIQRATFTLLLACVLMRSVLIETNHLSALHLRIFLNSPQHPLSWCFDRTDPSDRPLNCRCDTFERVLMFFWLFHLRIIINFIVRHGNLSLIGRKIIKGICNQSGKLAPNLHVPY